jgi:hypothetical protein
MKRLELTKGQYALVDDADFPQLNQHAWSATWAKSTESYYAKRKEKGKSIMLQRQIMKPRKGKRVDFIDGDSLNCQRINLQIGTPSQVMGKARQYKTNKTGYRGVIAPTGRHRWRANISTKGKMLKSGNFDSAEEAAKEYDRLAIKHFGRFARLNFPQG